MRTDCETATQTEDEDETQSSSCEGAETDTAALSSFTSFIFEEL